jgi:hypothetical protein
MPRAAYDEYARNNDVGSIPRDFKAWGERRDAEAVGELIESGESK